MIDNSQILQDWFGQIYMIDSSQNTHGDGALEHTIKIINCSAEAT
jgi:hypothetical protein